MGGHFPPSQKFVSLRHELPISLDPFVQLGQELFNSSGVRRLQGLLVVVCHDDDSIRWVAPRDPSVACDGRRTWFAKDLDEMPRIELRVQRLP
jgi:hypothetical protein